MNYELPYSILDKIVDKLMVKGIERNFKRVREAEKYSREISLNLSKIVKNSLK